MVPHWASSSLASMVRFPPGATGAQAEPCTVHSLGWDTRGRVSSLTSATY